MSKNNEKNTPETDNQKEKTMTQEKEEIRSEVGNRLLCKAMRIILDAGGSKPFSELRAELDSESIPDKFRQIYEEKSKLPQWVGAIHSVAEGFDKAGFLTRKSGVWGVTPAGEVALEKGDAYIIQEAKEAASELNKQRAETRVDKPADEDERFAEKVVSDTAKGDERKSMLDRIREETENSRYAENLAEALLRALGYEVEQTPPSRDGGFDVKATVGELGLWRIFVEVKNRQVKAGEPMVRDLAGVLANKSNTDAGILISFSGFAPGAKTFAEGSSKRIKLMDGYDFIDLWRKHYDKLSDEDKKLLPLHPDKE